jgi:hypothetical protein
MDRWIPLTDGFPRYNHGQVVSFRQTYIPWSILWGYYLHIKSLESGGITYIPRYIYVFKNFVHPFSLGLHGTFSHPHSPSPPLIVQSPFARPFFLAFYRYTSPRYTPFSRVSPPPLVPPLNQHHREDPYDVALCHPHFLSLLPPHSQCFVMAISKRLDHVHFPKGVCNHGQGK